MLSVFSVMANGVIFGFDIDSMYLVCNFMLYIYCNTLQITN